MRETGRLQRRVYVSAWFENDALSNHYYMFNMQRISLYNLIGLDFVNILITHS